MGGTIRIAPGFAWPASTGLYCFVVGRLVDQLSDEDSAPLRSWLGDSMKEDRGLCVDLQELSPSDRLRLKAALRSALEFASQATPQDFGVPQYYNEYVVGLQSCCELVHQHLFDRPVK